MSETAVALKGEAVEVALAEATAVLAMVQDEDRRGRLADLIAAIEDGEVQGESAQALEELLELGLQTGRLRALYGPAGEQAALKTYRKLPGGKELAESARRGVAGALVTRRSHARAGVAERRRPGCVLAHARRRGARALHPARPLGGTHQHDRGLTREMRRTRHQDCFSRDVVLLMPLPP